MNSSEIVQTARKLRELLIQRERQLEQKYPDDFPVLEDFCDDEKLNDGICHYKSKFRAYLAFKLP